MALITLARNLSRLVLQGKSFIWVTVGSETSFHVINALLVQFKTLAKSLWFSLPFIVLLGSQNQVVLRKFFGVSLERKQKIIRILALFFPFFWFLFQTSMNALTSFFLNGAWHRVVSYLFVLHIRQMMARSWPELTHLGWKCLAFYHWATVFIPLFDLN